MVAVNWRVNKWGNVNIEMTNLSCSMWWKDGDWSKWKWYSLSLETFKSLELTFEHYIYIFLFNILCPGIGLAWCRHSKILVKLNCVVQSLPRKTSNEMMQVNMVMLELFWGIAGDTWNVDRVMKFAGMEPMLTIF